MASSTFFDFDASLDELDNTNLDVDAALKELDSELSQLNAKLSDVTPILPNTSSVLTNGAGPLNSNFNTNFKTSFMSLPPSSTVLPSGSNSFQQPLVPADMSAQGWVLTHKPCPHITTCPGKGQASLFEKDGERYCPVCGGRWQRKPTEMTLFPSQSAPVGLGIANGTSRPSSFHASASRPTSFHDTRPVSYHDAKSNTLSPEQDPPPRSASINAAASPLLPPSKDTPSRPTSTLVLDTDVEKPAEVSPLQTPPVQPTSATKKKAGLIASLFATGKPKKKASEPNIARPKSTVVETTTSQVGNTTVVAPTTSRMSVASTFLPSPPGLPLEKTKEALIQHLNALQAHLTRVNQWMDQERDSIYATTVLENSKSTTEAISSAMKAVRDLA